MSFLNAEQPDVLDALAMLDIDVVWHPFASYESGDDAVAILKRFTSGKEKLEFLMVEGAICNGPNNTGKYFMFHGRPFREWIRELADVAEYTLAIGTCSSFGGIPAAGSNPMEASGLQYLRLEKGGFLGADYTARSGFPVINLGGCPAHPDWIVETLAQIAGGSFSQADLDHYNRPKLFYSKLAHHACPRNEYYEFKASAQEYSQQGCLFENLGCKATQCESDCNERLWLGRTGSCTRGGFPCISCTSPKFPDGYIPFFETEKIGDIPTTLPLDVPKAWYVGISGLTKLACPKRLLVNAVSYKRVDIDE